MPELSRNARVTEASSRSVGHPHLASDMSPRPLPPAPPPPLPPSRVVRERLARVDALAVHEPPREPAPPALAKAKASPPPLPPAARPSRVTPPPLPAAVHVASQMASTIASSTRDVEIPDFLDGAARRRRVLWMVSAVAGLVLLAAVVATIASHYRPM
jgi:hypothetical protein